MNKKIGVMIVLVVVLMFLAGCTPVGEAIGNLQKMQLFRKAFFIKPAPQVLCLTGCYLELPNREIKIAETQGDCRSYSLAFQYADVKDALRLVLKEKPQETQLNEEINNPGESYGVKYKDCAIEDGPEIIYFDQQDSEIKENCEWTDFFGVPLFCFNIGKDNLKKIIAPLTFLKMAGYSGNYNSLQADFADRGFLDFEPYIEPFEVIKKEETIYVNGWAQDELQLALGDNDLNCGPQPEEKINSCSRTMDESMKNGVDIYSHEELISGQPFSYLAMGEGVKFAAIMYLTEPKGRSFIPAFLVYHEAHHKLFGSHGAALDVKAELNCPMMQTLEDYDGRTGDKGWATPNGVEAELYFQLSANNFLDCDDRNELYEKGKFKLQTQLCKGFLCPEHPKNPWLCVDNLHIFPEPVCS